jgi:hypothetical protein
LDEQVNVIGHYFQSVNGDVELSSNLRKQESQAHGDVIDQDGTTVLRTPHEVILQAKDGVCVFPVSCFHTGIIQMADN